MREISPAANLSVDEYVASLHHLPRQYIARIRRQKVDNKRPHPSATLVDQSVLLTANIRADILDHVATLVDENVFGRSEMCKQFADLLMRALVYLELPACAEIGTVTYYSGNTRTFGWEHAWVRIGREVVDGNVDSLFENPMVPKSVNIPPYWGPINKLPKDRIFSWNKAKTLPMGDIDVSNIWWPELQNWLDQNVIAR
ncbi:MAG: hypothetical protein WCK35_24030 [Chloroflexota bacterium]